ncbi:ABC transporter permease [Paenibacillus alvei]|uniref:ABC transporter permease n=1 Tax=Paenibacillus alvei TaxID=44250 RepID=UPI0018CF05BE|nr:ABC transporter permease [Paenibacillus alvei]MBG9733707.1 ABC transporter permease [Paenibacillus alvei]MBG9745750.1 ABC transporter permease [Paenibacillus alvei]MCY9580415.1 ABC transporter permease [Paenibacillus alvei]MCY9583259.1 ABC transporter permease [Paenibacillus alvei]
MNFRQFAFKNVIRNARLYAGYFISSAFSVMIFFVYSMLAFHPELNLAESGGFGKGAQTGMQVAQYIIYVFTFFFILYSMSVFLKTRKKEFGVCIMQGMSNMQLKRLVFLENTIIGFASTVTGIAAGLILSKGMLMLGSSMLYLEHSLSFYFPTKALWFTFVAFMLLFLAISFFTATILRTSSLIDLLKASTKPKPEPKASVWLAILAAMLLLIGYAIAFVVRGALVMLALLPVVILVSIGTYFLFTQLSVYIIHKLKKNKKLYRRGTNMLTLSDLAYRMKDNARMFFLVAIISTVAFTAIGTLVGFKAMLTESVAGSMPPLSYESRTGDKQEQKHIAYIEAGLKKENISYDSFVIHNKDAKLQDRYSFNAIPVSDYNRISEDKIAVDAGSAILLQFKMDDFGYNRGKTDWSKGQTLTLSSGSKLQLADVPEMSRDVRQYMTAHHVLVMSDEDFKVLPTSKTDMTNHIFNMDNWQSTKKLSEQLEKQLNADQDATNYRFSSRALAMTEVNQGMGQILLTGLFVGIVFFVAAGSFLYFRLFSDLDHDIIQYRAISKLGLTEGELSKIVSTQIGLLFFVPIIVAILHGAVALNTLQNLFPQISILKEIVLVLGTFFVIQVLYFLFIRANYVKKLKKVL